MKTPPLPLQYLSAYPASLQQQVQSLIENNQLADYLTRKYPQQHEIRSDKALRGYVMVLKNRHMRKSPVLNHVAFDNRLHVIHNALGVHKRRSQVQGGKLKRKQEILIASSFKKAPAALLEMIVVHELAHLKEHEHNKNFYALCEYMLPDYHQRELGMRIYLLHQALKAL